jgi:hypothetical protein
MKREKRLTKREKKEQAGGGHKHEQGHIHCIACGRHIDPSEFQQVPATGVVITCEHKSQFPACANCEVTARYLVAEHDRTGKPVNTAAAYH